jgi:hypothetical protein
VVQIALTILSGRKDSAELPPTAPELKESGKLLKSIFDEAIEQE